MDKIADQGGESAVQLLLRLASTANPAYGTEGLIYTNVTIMNASNKPYQKVAYIGERLFRLWLTWLYYKERNDVPPVGAIQSVIDVLEAEVMFGGLEAKINNTDKKELASG